MKILIITAHPDDLEFAMGGTLNQLAMNKKKNLIKIIVMSDSQTIEENQEYNLFEECNASIRGIYGLPFSMRKFETMEFFRDYQKIRDTLYPHYKNYKPDVVFCTSQQSAHPDHKIIGMACDSIFTESTLIEIEDVRGNQRFRANKWNEISEKDIQAKMNSLSCYTSQKSRSYMNFDAITAMAKYRGLQMGKPLAEAFRVVRELNNIKA